MILELLVVLLLGHVEPLRCDQQRVAMEPGLTVAHAPVVRIGRFPSGFP
jgi:hypothetical protein